MYVFYPFIYITGILLTFAGSLDVWIEPSWISNTTTSKSKYASYQAQIFACKGEEESFQVHLISNDNLSGVYLTEVNPIPKFPPPRIYLVKTIDGIPLPQGGIDRSVSIPDVLYPQSKIDVQKGQKVIFWVTYRVPVEIEAKTYQTELALMGEEKKLKRIPVKLNIFDFKIDSISSLPAISFIDPNNILTIGKTSSNDSKFYEELFRFLREKRLSISLTSYPNYLNSSYPKPDLQLLSSLLTNGPYDTVIDTTPLLIPPGPLETVRTPTVEEENIWKIIQDKSKNSRLISIFFIPEDKRNFPSLKKFLGSIAEQAPLIERVLCGAPFSNFNTQVDNWAIPFYYYSYDLINRLKNGVPLSDESKVLVKSVSSSSKGPMPAIYPQMMSSAENLIDGNIHVGWFSLPVKDESKKEWIEIQLKEPIQGEKVLVIWGKFQTPRSVAFSISKDGIHYFSSSVNWKHFTGHPFEYPLSVATFKYSPEFIGLKLEFSKLKKGEILNIQEIIINPPEKDEEPLGKALSTINPWLLVVPNDFPSLVYYAHPIEARLIPWICWNLELSGVILTPLGCWGNTLTKPRDTNDFVFMPQDALQATTLLYPSIEHGWIPSIRIERLRDGLEDYEYIKLLNAKAVSKELSNKELYSLLIKNPEHFLPWNATDEKFIEQLMKLRILMGIELSEKKVGFFEKSPRSHREKPEKYIDIFPQPVKKNFRGRTDKK